MSPYEVEALPTHPLITQQATFEDYIIIHKQYSHKIQVPIPQPSWLHSREITCTQHPTSFCLTQHFTVSEVSSWFVTPLTQKMQKHTIVLQLRGKNQPCNNCTFSQNNECNHKAISVGDRWLAVWLLFFFSQDWQEKVMTEEGTGLSAVVIQVCCPRQRHRGEIHEQKQPSHWSLTNYSSLAEPQ